MKYSFIVPIYNVEKYIDRCIESIVNQTYKDFEIILVDDESPDRCPKICEEWSQKDDRIRVIHKKNEGLGMARNSGLQVAEGEYIAFVDSDDYICENYLEILDSRIIATENPDVCLFGYTYVTTDGELYKHINYSDTVYDEKAIKEELLPRAFSTSIRKIKDEYGIGAAWGGVYKFSFLKNNGLVFQSEREVLSEDLLFSISLCLKASKISFCRECLYYYCQNNQSLSKSYRCDRFEKSQALFHIMDKIVVINELNKEAQVRLYENFFINVIVCLKQEIIADKSYKEKRKVIKSIVNSDEFHLFLINFPIKSLDFTKIILALTLKFKWIDCAYLLTWMKNK